jgi:hypothetical protein
MTGSLADAINSDVTILTLPTGEIVTLFDIEFGRDIPRNRRSTRAGKLDTYGPEFEDFAAKATCDKATANVIEALTVLDARKALVKTAVTITGQALSGAGADMVATGNAEFFNYRVIAPEGGQDVTISFAAVFNNDLNIA